MTKSSFQIYEVPENYKNEFNRFATHPMQSWEWGSFRNKTGITVIRLGKFAHNRLIETAQMTIHPLPFTNYALGYVPKGGIPSKQMIEKLYETGKKRKCIFIKLEPNVVAQPSNYRFLIHDSKFMIRTSPHPLFTKYTFRLDLSESEETLLKNMHPKTRYNIRIAQKHAVKIVEETSSEAFDEYLNLQSETTKRQKFFAHTEKYHRLMWDTLMPPKIARLLCAKYINGQKEYTLASWIVFLFNDVLYYPYGGSSNLFRNVMANNLMMWETILYGKKNGAKIFDMWGALGPNPDPSDPWYGFHRFKQGYSPQLTQFLGSFDLVIKPSIYKMYNVAYQLREVMLKIKSILLSR